MTILLDTSVCIAVMRGQEGAVSRMASLAPSECAVSTIAMYELLTGVAKCRQPEREGIKVKRLLSVLTVVTFDKAAAEHAAYVRADLERTGRICGPYDLMLAGHALSVGLSLATNNAGEFSRVRGLRVEDWMAGSI